MAIIYSYPTVAPGTGDQVIGTKYYPDTEENKTVQFNVGQINSLGTTDYLETTVTLTNAQWLALPGTDVMLVEKAGVGKYIKVITLSVFFNPSGANFTWPNPLNVGYGGNPITNAQGIIAADAVGFGADKVFSVVPLAATLEDNASLFIGTLAGATAGGGSVQVKVRYQVLDITAF